MKRGTNLYAAVTLIDPAVGAIVAGLVVQNVFWVMGSLGLFCFACLLARRGPREV